MCTLDLCSHGRCASLALYRPFSLRKIFLVLEKNKSIDAQKNQATALPDSSAPLLNGRFCVSYYLGCEIP
jgi:hypothetical protein